MGGSHHPHHLWSKGLPGMEEGYRTSRKRRSGGQGNENEMFSKLPQDEVRSREPEVGQLLPVSEKTGESG